MAVNLVETERDEHVLVIRMCRSKVRRWAGVSNWSSPATSSWPPRPPPSACPEVRRGLVPTSAGLFRAPSAFPLNLARELILTGEPIDANRAHAAGFVNLVAEPGHAVDAALGLAKRICLSGPVAVRACLAAVNGILADDDDRGWEATRTAAAATIAGSDDTREGVQAFFERRPPVWTGR
jgi:enoyl-CoA hydratase